MYRTLAVSGYRSLRDVVLRLGRVTVVTGGNGSGKSSVHKSLRLLAACGQGEVIRSLAMEGGLSSILWAGPESLDAARRTGQVQGTTRKGPIALKIGIGSDSLSYLIDLGIPPQDVTSLFGKDPEIKRESLWVGPIMRPGTMLARRKRAGVEIKSGRSWEAVGKILTHETMLDANAIPELRDLRDELAAWRFYDALRTDSTAPARSPQVGTRARALDEDGANLAATLQTIIERGRTDVDGLVEDAFPGSQLRVFADDGIFDVTLLQPGMLRPLRSAELSDGTLRYLMLLAALHPPQQVPLIALNEPENSLHSSLFEPLARMIVRASNDTEIFVVTHSPVLLEALTAADGTEHVRLEKDLGETMVVDQGLLTRPQWEWGSR